MGFLTNLGKGFIRSAVNQVGRDSGKVISNNIYGNAHATPVRHVRVEAQAQAQTQAQTQFVEEENLSVNDREKAISEGYRVNAECGMSGGRIALYILYVLLSFSPSAIFSLVFMIVFIRWGQEKRKRDFTYLEKSVRVPNTVPDRRYKYGYRVEGYRVQTERIITPATFEEQELYKRKGRNEIIMAVIPFIFNIVLIYVMKYVVAPHTVTPSVP